MKNIRFLSDEWQRWILENVGRQCTPQSIIEQMIANGFDPIFAGMQVYQSFSATSPGTSTHEAAPVRRFETGKQTAYRYGAARFPAAGNTIRTADRDVRVAFRIDRPVAAVLENLLSDDECDELIRQAELKLQRSTVIDPHSGHAAVIADRSSFGAFFQPKENDAIAAIEARLAQVMHWPEAHGEGLQVMQYRPGGEYKPHFDYFPPDDPGSRNHLAHGGQRVSTLIVYLNDVEKGGETVLPEIGLRIVPKKGAACYFEYCNEAGQLDPLTLHGGLPVAAGEKWIATKWMRQEKV